MRGLHQFVPSFGAGAVGAHMLQVQRVARDIGWRSEIFAAEVQAPYKRAAQHYTDYGSEFSPGADDVLLYHLASGSPLASWLTSRRQPLVVDYHNVTPVEFYARWDRDLAADAARARRQLHQLASRACFALADSEFNEQDLRAARYVRTAVVPVMVDRAQLEAAPHQGVLDRLRRAKGDGGTDWLFVGRVVPHKAQHDIVGALAAYRRAYDPQARLHLVGDGSAARYFESVARFAERLGLGDAVTMTGPVTAEQMAAYYRSADVFVCLSEHEGFCVPLLEAWYHAVPVVAFAASAVPETLGPAGLLLNDKEPGRVAAAVHRVIVDSRLRATLTAAGATRLTLFSLERSAARLVEALEEINAAVAGA